MIYMTVIYQILLSLKVFKIVGEVPLELDDQALWSKFIYPIVMILAMKHVTKYCVIIF